MRRRAITILTLLAAVLGNARAAEHVYAFKNEEYPQHPFVLTASVDRETARIGDTLRVSYRLANTSDVAISTCASGWTEYSIVGGDGKSKGIVIVHKDGISSFNFLRLPPHTTLSWESDCEILDVAPGTGAFIARFQSSSMCSYLWQGKVESTSIPITVLPAE
jgi:hypothetical protein